MHFCLSPPKGTSPPKSYGEFTPHRPLAGKFNSSPAEHGVIVDFQVSFMIKKGIAVIGSTTIDNIIKKDSTSYFKLGGVTTYSGITYSRHGIVTHVVTNVATKDSAILKKLSRENIGVHNGFTEDTTHFENYSNGDYRSQCIPHTAKPINLGQIIEVMDLVDGIHLGPLHPLDIQFAVLKSLRDSRSSIFLDIQGYVRSTKDKTVYPAVSQHLTDALVAAQIVKANELELKTILHDCQTNLNGLMVKYNIKEFVVSRGEKGGFVKTINAEEIVYKAAPIQIPDDSTGAGDVFFAAYIIGRFVKDKDVMDACNYAASIAARQVEGMYITRAELSLYHR
jgi:sugar/nucleoside kinase (ribokinase family)